MKKSAQNKKGIAIFIAVITVSALLLVALAIADISYKEQIISYAGKDSKVAFYAADSGLECAYFFDLKGGYTGDFNFATSTITASPSFTCNGIATNPNTVANATSATTTFYFNVSVPDGSDPKLPNACAIVRVSKRSISGSYETIIESRGYNNTCLAGQGPTANPQLTDNNPRNLERAMRSKYD